MGYTTYAISVKFYQLDELLYCCGWLQQVHKLAALLPTMLSLMAASFDPPNYVHVLLGVTFSVVAYILWHAVHCRPELQKMDFRYLICGR